MRLGSVMEFSSQWWLLAICFIGQSFFFMRFFWQWIASEKAQKSIIPVNFWYFSLFGSWFLLAYAILRRDIVFIIGQSTGLIIYIRNIFLIQREKNKSIESMSRADTLWEHACIFKQYISNRTLHVTSPEGLRAALFVRAVIWSGFGCAKANHTNTQCSVRLFSLTTVRSRHFNRPSSAVSMPHTARCSLFSPLRGWQVDRITPGQIRQPRRRYNLDWSRNSHVLSQKLDNNEPLSTRINNHAWRTSQHSNIGMRTMPRRQKYTTVLFQGKYQLFLWKKWENILQQCLLQLHDESILRIHGQNTVRHLVGRSRGSSRTSYNRRQHHWISPQHAKIRQGQILIRGRVGFPPPESRRGNKVSTFSAPLSQLGSTVICS